MIRVDRAELTRNEIIRVAANRFLNDGYTKTTVASLAKTLGMSTGNMTFYFPSKDRMLAALVELLVKYQRQLMEDEIKDGYDPITAVCLELLTIASACEQDEVAKDFFISSYTSPVCLEVIRKNDIKRAKEVFKGYCSDWTDERFAEAETLVSGIEYATLQLTNSSASFEARVSGALEFILTIYNIPKELRSPMIEKVLAVDYKALGLRVLKDFRVYVDKETEQMLVGLMKRKQQTE